MNLFIRTYIGGLVFRLADDKLKFSNIKHQNQRKRTHCIIYAYL